MKILLTCMECSQVGEARSYYWKDFSDDNVYQFNCEKGHVSACSIQENKFELLFELGMHAIVDGYYREAVVSFTSALERFYEFYIRVVSLKHGVAEVEREAAWSEIAAQSERQLGAYTFLYLIENKQNPCMLEKAKGKFRNKVVHRGVVPTRDEAVEYGQSVLDVIIPVLNGLKERDSEFITELYFQEAIKKCRQTMSMPTVLSTTRSYEAGWFDINKRLAWIEDFRKRYP